MCGIAAFVVIAVALVIAVRCAIASKASDVNEEQEWLGI